MSSNDQRENAKDANMLAPAGRVPESLRDGAPSKTDVAARFTRSQFSPTNDPRIRNAIAAITIHYPNLDPLMGDIQVLGGTQLYLSAKAWDKEMHAKVPLACRRWVKRRATNEEYEEWGVERWQRNPEVRAPWESADGPVEANYMGFGSRLWFIELYLRGWDQKTMQAAGDGAGSSVVLTQAKPEGEWYVAASGFGEANPYNCTLQNPTKMVGDPRVLDLMAIKRGKHALIQEQFSMTLRGAKNLDQIQLLEGGLRMLMEDGLTDDQAQDVIRANAVATVASGEATVDRDGLVSYATKLGIPVRDLEPVITEALKTADPTAFIQARAPKQGKTATEQAHPLPGNSAAKPTTEVLHKHALELGLFVNPGWDVRGCLEAAQATDDPYGYLTRIHRGQNTAAVDKFFNPAPVAGEVIDVASKPPAEKPRRKRSAKPKDGPADERTAFDGPEAVKGPENATAGQQQAQPAQQPPTEDDEGAMGDDSIQPEGGQGGLW